VLKKRPVILGNRGEFIRELPDKPITTVLPAGQRLIYHMSKTSFGYRSDKILEEILAHNGNSATFGATVASALLLQVLWDKLKIGQDSTGSFVEIVGRRFYPDYRAVNNLGKSLWTFKDGVPNFLTKIQVGDVNFTVDTLTVCYLLFYNLGEFNPLEKNGTAMIRTLDSEVCSENILLVEGGAWKAKIKSLLNSLSDRNLLLRGNLSYYCLISDEDLGLSLDSGVLIGGSHDTQKIMGAQ
jgi:hypothetical protein